VPAGSVTAPCGWGDASIAAISPVRVKKKIVLNQVDSGHGCSRGAALGVPSTAHAIAARLALPRRLPQGTQPGVIYGLLRSRRVICA